jgi:CcdB protein.
MAQFDVHRNGAGGHPPYLLVVQSDLLRGLDTVAVVPLVPASMLGDRPIRGLYPVFTIDGQRLAILTAQIAGVPLAVLGERVDSLAQYHHEIIGALDILATGV